MLATKQMALLAISETWLNSCVSDEELVIDGYCLFRRDRPDQAGGGVCIYVLDTIPAKLDVQFNCPDLELLWVRLQLHNHGSGLLVGCLYRPPSSDGSFWTHLEGLLEGAEGEEVIVLGDLNVDFLQTGSRDFDHLNRAMLLPLNLTNLITQATRFSKHGQTSLDAILSNSTKLHSGSVEEFDLSDHCLVSAPLNYTSGPSATVASRKRYLRRDFRQFDPLEFQQLLHVANLSCFQGHDVDHMWSEWSGKFLDCLDKVAPLKSYSPSKRRCPFMSAELLKPIHQRKAAYRKVCTTKFQDEKLLKVFRCLRSLANNLYRRLRNADYHAACQSYRDKPRLLWSVISCVTGRKQHKHQVSIPPSELNEHFCKIVTDEAVTYALPYGPPQPEDLVCFAEVTNASVHSILSHLDPFKSPGPDGILPSMLKQFASVLAPSLAVIFDRSLQTAIVPAEFKKANIVPIPKNNKGDPMALTNYRPVSLNAVLSKVLEKLVRLQVEEQFDYRQPLDDMQFGFHKNRSAAQLLVRGVNDWLLARDSGLSTVVVFVDLSKAFDRVRHQP